MNNTRQGDIMVNDNSLDRLAPGSVQGSNRDPYDSMDSAITEAEDCYETLGRNGTSCTGCGVSTEGTRNDTNTRRNVYTRYIRPCGTFPNRRENSSSNNTPKPIVPVTLQTLKKSRSSKARRNKRNILLSFVFGLVFGFVICSVCWLTADRLKQTGLVCEFMIRADDADGETAQSTTVSSVTTAVRGQFTSTEGKNRTSFESGLITGLLQTTIPVVAISTSSGTNSTSIGLLSKLLNTTVPSDKTTSPLTGYMQTQSNSTTPATVSTQTAKYSTASSLFSKSRTEFTRSISTPSNIKSASSTSPSFKTTSLPESISKSTLPSRTQSASFNSITSTPSQFLSNSTAENVDTSTTLVTTTERIATTHSASTHMTESSKTVDTTKPNQHTINTTIKTTSESEYFKSSDHQSSQKTSSTFSTSQKSDDMTTSSTSFSAITAELPTYHPPGQEALIGGTYTEEIASTSSVSATTISRATVTPRANATPETVAKRSVQGGHVYVRWGGRSCSVGADHLYTGYAASGHWQHPGGATNTICLPEMPSWGNYSNSEDADRNLIYGTEYGSSDASFASLTGQGEKWRYRDVPCSVCKATGRLSHVMVPGRSECFPGWTQEYTGYMMGSGYVHSHASELICVDSSLEHVPNTDTVKGGNFLYFAEVRSGSLPSTSYPSGRELACAVCTL